MENVKVMLLGVKAIVVRFEGACGYLLMDLSVCHRRLRCTYIVAVAAGLPDSSNSRPSCNSIKRWEVNGSKHICE